MFPDTYARKRNNFRIIKQLKFDNINGTLNNLFFYIFYNFHLFYVILLNMLYEFNIWNVFQAYIYTYVYR